MDSVSETVTVGPVTPSSSSGREIVKPAECRSSASLFDVVVQALFEKISTDIAHIDVVRNLCICPAPGKGGPDLSPGCIFQATAVSCHLMNLGTILCEEPSRPNCGMLVRQPKYSDGSQDNSLVREHEAMCSLMDETPTFLTFNY